MLRRIRIQNHALIHEVELTLDAGFHVFTGETGSGKSILLGAVGLLLGDRADTSGVGLHGDRAVIEGEFVAPQMRDWLAEADLPDTMSISIRREVLRNGRSRVFINDAQATVSQLRELGNQLVSIHRQDDLGEVLERPALAHVLDLAGGHHDVKTSYESAFTTWREAHRALQSLESLLRAPSGDVHYLRHQIEELQGLRLPEVEWNALESELHSLQHATDLHAGLAHAAHACDADEKGVLTSLEDARRALMSLEGVDADVDQALERLSSVRIEMQDLSATLHDLVERKQPDPARLNALEARHDALMRAMRKHGVDSIQALMDLLDQLGQTADSLDGLEAQVEEARGEERRLRRSLNEAGHALTEARKRAGEQLAEAVLPLLGQLKMPHAQMDWAFPACEPDPIGMDVPEIWFTTNPGSPLLPLVKVASGGERARFMLALKSVLAELQSTPVVVLDEIDTGVSGEVAEHMGRAMKNIALAQQTQQVLAVTHLPQVAALAQHHWEVHKTTDGASTHVSVHALNGQDRRYAVATMLSGSNVTEEALGQAAKLIAAS